MLTHGRLGPATATFARKQDEPLRRAHLVEVGRSIRFSRSLHPWSTAQGPVTAGRASRLTKNRLPLRGLEPHARRPKLRRSPGGGARAISPTAPTPAPDRACSCRLLQRPYRAPSPTNEFSNGVDKVIRPNHGSRSFGPVAPAVPCRALLFAPRLRRLTRPSASHKSRPKSRCAPRAMLRMRADKAACTRPHTTLQFAPRGAAPPLPITNGEPLMVPPLGPGPKLRQREPPRVRFVMAARLPPPGGRLNAPRLAPQARRASSRYPASQARPRLAVPIAQHSSFAPQAAQRACLFASRST